MDELNIGLIGAGRMGAYHVETWERIACGTPRRDRRAR